MIALMDMMGPILQTGAVGAMLIVMVRWIKAKDRKSYELIDQQNKERQQMYESHNELVREVTKALMDKNHTDDKMSAAVTKLSEELREVRETLKGLNNEAT
jgi:predicted DCC family thiol-disulfide oxidoreductase YuxK